MALIEHHFPSFGRRGDEGDGGVHAGDLQAVPLEQFDGGVEFGVE